MTPRLGIAFLLLLSTAVVTRGENPKAIVGIAPVFDGSGADFGETFAQHLTLFIYQELLASPTVHPVLLSPGGVYSPLDLSWLVDYAHDRPDINFLLVATLKPVANPEKDRWSIPVDLLLLRASTGEKLARWSENIQISWKKTFTDYGNFTAPSRKFEKQPLGKACAKLAISIKDALLEKVAGTPPDQSASSALSSSGDTSAGSCPIHLRITYGYKHSASQSYVLLENGLDQSTNLKEGVASFSAPEGDLLLQFSVNDAPFKMETEKLYQISTWHSCHATNLNLDLGPGGDVHPHWE